MLFLFDTELIIEKMTPEKKSTDTQQTKAVKTETPSSVSTAEQAEAVILEGDKKEEQRKKWVELFKNQPRSYSVSLNLARVYGNIPSDQQGFYLEEYDLWIYPQHSSLGFGDPRKQKKQEHTVVIALNGERSQGKIVRIKDEIWVCRGGNFTVGRPRKAEVFWETYKGEVITIGKGKNKFAKVCKIEDSSKMFKQIVSYVKEIDRIRKMWTNQNKK
ncbi:MAG: hypothetical protein KAH77_07840 [Thiomargarita sp.]|nr:hypothetical protein [Thiomargarita sp.]